MKKLFKPVIIAVAAAMALSATAFAADNFAYSLNIDGKATDTDVLVLVPLRETAENLGFKVLWNNDGTILFDDGVMHSYITIGKNDYIVSTSVDDMVGTSAPFSLSSAPIISGGKTYVPVEFFRPLMGNSDDIIKTDGSVISINKNVVSIPEKENEGENAQLPNTFTEHIRVSRSGPILPVNVKTMPHPGFPTDMQPQMATMLCCAGGTSIVSEGVWDNRFKYVDELRKMGANIQVDGKVAVIEGVERLTGAPVRALDLRAGAAMLIAGLMADGRTEVEDIHHIERGYSDLVEKLNRLGAEICKVPCTELEAERALS